MRQDRKIRPVLLGLSAGVVVALAGYIVLARFGLLTALLASGGIAGLAGMMAYLIGTRLREGQDGRGVAGDTGPVVHTGWLAAAVALALAVTSFVLIGPDGTAPEWAAAAGLILVVVAGIRVLGQRLNENRR